MKKFLISFIIGVTMIAIGVTTLVFEIKDFEFIDHRYDTHDTSTQVQSTTFSDKNPTLDIDNSIRYEWENDNSMKDGEVRVEAIPDISVKISRKRIKIEYHKSKSYYLNHRYGTDWDMFMTFLEGLKERKIYVTDEFSTVCLTSNATTRNSFTIQYDD